MWFVIPVANGTEVFSSEKCQQIFPKGCCHRAFVPKYICLRKYQGEWREESRVLFPGYFFVDMDEAKEEEEVSHTAFLRQALPLYARQDIVCLYPEEQLFLMSLFDAGGTIQMSRGDIVHGSFDIRQGPLQKKEACIRRIDRHKRIAEIELRIHGEQKRIRVGLEIVNKT